MVMDNIIEFSQRRRDKAVQPAREGPATIIIFPGIRYERCDDGPAAPQTGAAARKPATDRRRR
ncbi:MAG: hypothetical protein KF849_01645 [Rhizobiaceae bacterium]|nr:hypothetical protein [Rhizobiaceae bacterium]